MKEEFFFSSTGIWTMVPFNQKPLWYQEICWLRSQPVLFFLHSLLPCTPAKIYGNCFFMINQVWTLKAMTWTNFSNKSLQVVVNNSGKTRKRKFVFHFQPSKGEYLQWPLWLINYAWLALLRQMLKAPLLIPCIVYVWSRYDVGNIEQRNFFHNFQMFFIVFDHANACASMRSLVKIHNSWCLQQLEEQFFPRSQ